MMTYDFLLLSIIFLLSALIVVPLAKKLKLGNVLGYLLAGILIGPSCFSLINDPNSILKFSELGVVFLLFVIGLELKPSRLWTMRKSIFGQGFFQVGLTSTAFSLICYSLGYSIEMSLVVGFALSLSSTAFALQLLAEKNELSTEHGRTAFSILLFQDIAVIPFMAIIPFLANEATPQGSSIWKSLAILILVFGIAKFVIRYFLRFVASTNNREVFTAATLLIVMGVAFLMENLHLSMALGAFLSGVLLSDSEYRHELESNIEPFKGLLLGLFFMAVGMSANLKLLKTETQIILISLIVYLGVKYLCLFLVGKASKYKNITSTRLAANLIQGSEFAFVVLGLGVNSQILPTFESDILVLVISLSMALTPIISILHDRFKFEIKTKEFDEIDEVNPVIIAGFGRFGQIFGRILRLLKIEFTALDIDPNQVEVVRQFGYKNYYGDASRLDLLEKAGADKAKLFIIAVDDVQYSIAIAKTVREKFPNLTILARARNRQHAFELMDLGIRLVERETLYSALKLSENMLKELGYSKEDTKKIIDKFEFHDKRLMDEQLKIYKNEKELINYSKIAQQQLADVFREDVK